MFKKKKNIESETNKSTSMRRKYLHMQIAQRKKTAGQKVFVDRPRAFSIRSKNLSSFITRFRRAGLVIGIIGLSLACIYVLFFSSFVDVTKIQIEKTGDSLSQDRLQPFIDDMKGRNLFFINGEKIATDIQSSFPNEVLVAKVKKSFPDKIILAISEYPSVLNFHVKSDAGEQKIVLNQIGFIIAQNKDFSGIPTLVLQSDKPLPIIEGTIIPKDKLEPIVTALTKFPEIFGMKIISGEWKKVERELHLKTDKNFIVWIDLTQDVEAQILKLKRALPKLDIYNVPLEYIDLRIAGADNEKVIFKRKK